jgi:hypothetical protein
MISIRVGCLSGSGFLTLLPNFVAFCPVRIPAGTLRCGLVRRLPLNRLMRVSDFIIIYLACGSPLVVQFFLDRPAGNAAAVLSRGALRLFVWPVFAMSLIYRLIRGLNVGTETQRERAITETLSMLQAELEMAALSGSTEMPVFDVRDTFRRYAGLATEFGNPTRPVAVTGIFEIVEHPFPEAASSCLNRRNSSRLSIHLDRARNDFIDVASNVCDGSTQGEKAAIAAVETARLVGDRRAMADLCAALGISDNLITLAACVDGAGDVWNAAAQNRSVAG